jgi:hypothetical protein|tara:strand:- start:754 stop:903 length:150 start_codon:yes stop_codon:yes gene_type:complete
MKNDTELIDAINHLTAQVTYNNLIFTEIRNLMTTHEVIYVAEPESTSIH